MLPILKSTWPRSPLAAWIGEGGGDLVASLFECHQVIQDSGMLLILDLISYVIPNSQLTVIEVIYVYLGVSIWECDVKT